MNQLSVFSGILFTRYSYIMSYVGEDGEMKLKEPGKQKLDKHNSWLKLKHPKLYFGLL